jgi:hypothetical protein
VRELKVMEQDCKSVKFPNSKGSVPVRFIVHKERELMLQREKLSEQLTDDKEEHWTPCHLSRQGLILSVEKSHLLPYLGERHFQL